ncbi:MAG: class II aldolase/adducin family protein [Sedimentisphaerales bacterium]
MSRQQKDKALADLIRMSRRAGKPIAWTQGSSGNTSVKTDDGKHIFIKASGTALRNMSIKKGWRRLRFDKVLSIINDSRLTNLPAVKRERETANRLLNACDDNFAGDIKPSIEAPLHALLGKCVIHLHPTAIGAYTSAKNGKSEIAKLFKNVNYSPLWIPHASSGLTLAKKAEELINGYQRRLGITPSVLFLAKHGLFVSAKTPDEAIRLTQGVINRCKSNLPGRVVLCRRPAEKDVKAAKIAIAGAISTLSGYRPNVSFFYNSNIAEFISRKDAAKLPAKGPLSAAEIVYAGGAPIWISSLDEVVAGLKPILKKGNGLPAAYVVKNLGLFIAANRENVSAIAEVISGSLFVRSRATQFGGVLALSRREQEFIKRCYLPQPFYRADEK